MLISTHQFPPIPEDTSEAAMAICPKGHPYLLIRDTFGTFFGDDDFADLYPPLGQPAEAPWRLALVTVLQFAEGLTDRQAADAVRWRIDWKYLLALPLRDTGFDFSVLSEFRDRLIAGQAEERLLALMLEHFRAHGWLHPRGRQRTDATHVLAAVRTLNWLEIVGETMRAALNALAIVAPDWLRSVSCPDWPERYGPCIEFSRLPSTATAQTEWAEQVGADGQYLLTAIDADQAFAWLREVPAVQTLRQVWSQRYTVVGGRLCFRSCKELPPAAQLIQSPYDPEARWSTKRSTTWLGYKVHVTETCDADTPHLIVDVTTTLATTADCEPLEDIQETLQERDLLPAQQVVDAGYVSGHALATGTQHYGIDLVGPPLPTRGSWQSREQNGYSKDQFAVDWGQQQVICPQGKRSSSWHARQDPQGRDYIQATFRVKDCMLCPAHAACTKAKCRHVALLPHDAELALQAARRRQDTQAFKNLYACRAGVEGTHSQGVHRCGLRRSRYLGLTKTHLQQVAIASALNLLRMAAWLAGSTHAQTHCSPFVRLMKQAA